VDTIDQQNRVDAKVSRVLAALLRKGYHGEVTFRLTIQDGVIQEITTSVEEKERLTKR
jgi:hypothetical protein